MSIKGIVTKVAKGYARSKSGHGAARRPVNRPVRRTGGKGQLVRGLLNFARKKV
ncbi:hypothetical protein [Roseivivax isoporae]|uniref:Uncharacterized protein n=1 Tax=Roseivivax isoporae LMG 25204 TaxID=1449351 RepID=X7F8P6_9RHOB|nr:hypothetical protein [Roseivivax isoporae]ETX28461.1 hypothetical protein RISW2_07090 [Roseivivax isoporae LMG 25204]